MKTEKASLVIIIACLIIAGLVIYLTRDKATGVKSIKYGATVWTKCVNTECKAQRQMEKRDYYASVQRVRKKNPMSTMDVPIECPECKEMSVRLATKCDKCKAAFPKAFVPGDYPDRCPECSYSAIEENASGRTTD